MYTLTYQQALSTGADNGFIIQCYTGASQCANSVVDNFTHLTAANTATCLADPRYMTWRAMTLKIDYTGNIDWWRTDSYWNSSATELASTMGTNLVLSSSQYTQYDNFAAHGTTGSVFGKTFVFAYGDGSGV